MGDRSKIEWTDATWNPIRARNRATGKLGHFCVHVSEGCRNCYAERLQPRFGNPVRYAASDLDKVEMVLDEAVLTQPLRWRRPRQIFVGSMTDVFGAWVEDAWLDQLFAVMAAAHWHTFQVLTKRPERMRTYLGHPCLPRRLARSWCFVGRNTDIGWTRQAWSPDGEESTPRHWPLPNVWVGTSCEDQATADARIPELLWTSAAWRFISAEPLLGAVDFTRLRCPNGCVPPEYCNRCYPDGGKATGSFNALGGGDIDCVIVGGESGPSARPMHPAWARAVRDQCAGEGVAFDFKQHGEWIGVPDLRHLDGGGGPGFGIFDHCQHDLEAECVRVGKATAGRLLDGAEHNGMREVRA